MRAKEVSEEDFEAAANLTQDDVRFHPTVIEEVLQGLNVEIDHSGAVAVSFVPVALGPHEALFESVAVVYVILDQVKKQILNIEIVKMRLIRMLVLTTCWCS